MTEFKKIGAFDLGQNKWKGKEMKQMKGGDKANFSRNKCKGKRRACNKSKKMNCFNCGKHGHFAHDCTESKVLYD